MIKEINIAKLPT